MSPTKELSTYLGQRGISISAVQKGTGLPRQVLYSSLGKNGKRELRADEFLQVCLFIEADPMRFAPKKVVKQDVMA